MKEPKTEKILIIQTAFIGDAILTLPMIQALKKMFMDITIDVMCIPSTEELFAASPFVNNVLVLDKRNKHRSIFALNSFAKALHLENYSRIYSPHRSFRTALFVMLSGIRETYGFSNSSLMHVYKYLIEYRTDHHEVQRNLDLISYEYSDESWRILPELKISENEVDKVNVFLNLLESNKDYICIAPGSVWNTKIYPIDYIEEIIKHVLANYSLNVILVGGKIDEEICSGIEAKFPGRVYSAAGKFTLVESIEILKRSKLLITNDSAPTHLAMCANIPAITIYCSTSAQFGFYPYNKKSRYVSYDDLFCKPCGIHGYMKCPINTFECAYKLKPLKIIERVEEILDDKIKSDKAH